MNAFCPKERFPLFEIRNRGENRRKEKDFAL